MEKGAIRVHTENIFPIIKKFLYSDHEIFIRELVSNAVDATQKLKTLSGIGEAKGELHARLLKMNLGGHIAAVQTEGQMTEREVVAKVRVYFGGGASRVQTPR